jgi:hypothetical protein
MRFGWHIGLPGPFGIGGTIWQSRRRRRRRKVWHGEIGAIGWRCAHNHQRQDTAEDCARREARRRGIL